MTEAKDTDHEAECQPIQVPNESEFLALCGRIAALRKSLVRQVRQIESAWDDFARIAEQTERRLLANEFDERFARDLRERIAEIDVECEGRRDWKRHARVAGETDLRIAEFEPEHRAALERIQEIDKAFSQDRISLGKVRELAGIKFDIKAARAALEAWLADPKNGPLHVRARELLWRLLPDSEQPALDTLVAEDNVFRREQNAIKKEWPSGVPSATAGRIFSRLSLGG